MNTHSLPLHCTFINTLVNERKHTLSKWTIAGRDRATSSPQPRHPGLCSSRQQSISAHTTRFATSERHKTGAMPVLPHLHSRAATAADSRILDSRQLGAAAYHAAHSFATGAKTLLKRMPTLQPRQNPQYCGTFIAACYQGLYAGPTPGAVVGIVLGSIAGFLIILWLLWILSQGGGFIRTSELREEDDVVVRHHRHRSRSPRQHRNHRSSYNAEMRHSSPRRDRVIRQERIVRDVPPPRADTSRVRESVIVDEQRTERRVDGDDIVEVIEEHSSISGAPPPRRKSRRQSSAYR